MVLHMDLWLIGGGGSISSTLGIMCILLYAKLIQCSGVT